MALQLSQFLFSQSLFPVLCNPKQNLPQTWSRQRCLRRSCVVKNKVSEAVDSRLTVYQPSVWSHDFIESLDTSFPTNCKVKMMELEKKVMGLLYFDYKNGTSLRMSRLQLLELIDDIERLGLGYRFQNDIKQALNKISSITENKVGIFEEEGSTTLHAESLRFRLLRQHGYHVAPDFLMRFTDMRGGLMGCLGTDIKGLLSLYEASHLGFEEERDLQEAKLFAIKHLMKLNNNKDQDQNEAVKHALELPLYRRMLRLEARWYIDAYAKRKHANPLLLELATLDFNMAQSELKTELQQVSKWWRNTSLASKLPFVRDRPMECFFWGVGMVFEPQYHCCRVGLTKVCTLITVIDDIYDVYGSLDELKIFTDAVKRWDGNALKHMPEYLQLGFQSLYNTINEIAQGESIPVLVKVWGELLEAFFVEAKWTHSKCMPTFDNYLDNAWQSVSGVVILTHGYFLIDQEIKKYSVESLEKYHDLLKWSSMIFRLCNDLGTSSDEIERGKTANAITCYMHDNGVCEEVSRQHIKTLIDEAWRKLIKARVSCSRELTNSFVDMAISLARNSHCTYQYGDGHGAPDARAQDRVLSLIIEPIIASERGHVLI